MILKASQRSGASQLARHLTNTADNERVEVHEIRGFVCDNVAGAFKEAQAVAMGTRAKQFLFSVSLSPPESESVSVETFENAIDRIEERNGLTGQPRVVIFHEKEGRRHAHAVWSRTDTASMTAIPLPFFKHKLRDLSRELYLENGWSMPRGLMNSTERDPRNFDLAEWQQAKRIGRDPRELKGIIQECWAVSDSKASFAQALECRGLYLAKGDRRSFVAVTYEGEVLSVPRQLGKQAKEIGKRLGDPESMPSVADIRQRIAAVIAPRLRTFIAEADLRKARAMSDLNEMRQAMKAAHTTERQRLDEGIAARRKMETRERAKRLRGGVRGLWDRMTGEHGRVKAINEREALACFRRDAGQREGLVSAQMDERRALQKDIRQVRQRHAKILLGLHRDLAGQSNDGGRTSGLAGEFQRAVGSDRPMATGASRPTAKPRERGSSFDI